jgi:hypothetical protein
MNSVGLTSAKGGYPDYGEVNRVVPPGPEAGTVPILTPMQEVTG